MGTYHPHRQRRPRRISLKRPRQLAPYAAGRHVARREQIASERELRRDGRPKSRRMAVRREHRASDALRADARSNLEAKARVLFPWDLLSPDRKIAAVLTGQPFGARCSRSSNWRGCSPA